MAAIMLCCNVSKCKKKLSERAVITSCSHIFCLDHGKIVFENGVGQCPACSSPLEDKEDIILQNLNLSEKHKSMYLSGLSPDTIMDIATRAIGFFVYQMNIDNVNKDTIIHHLRQQNEELKDYCSDVTNKFQKAVCSHKQELYEKSNEIESQRQLLAQSSRVNNNLQAKVQALKRDIAQIKMMQNHKHNLHTSPNYASAFSYQEGIDSKPYEFQVKLSPPFEFGI